MEAAAAGKARARARRPQTATDKAVQKAIDVKNARELGSKRYRRATSMLNAILKKDPESPNAHRALAWVLVAQGKRAAARAEFEKAKANMQEDDNNYNEVSEALVRVTASLPASEPGKDGAPAGMPGEAAPPSPGGPDAGAAPTPGGPPPMPGATDPMAAPAPGGTPSGDGGMPPSPGGPGAPADPAAGGSPGGAPGAAGAVTPPPAESTGGGFPIPLIAGGIGGLALIGVLVKKFVLDKKATS
jgi:hypothetical protein